MRFFSEKMVLLLAWKYANSTGWRFKKIRSSNWKNQKDSLCFEYINSSKTALKHQLFNKSTEVNMNVVKNNIWILLSVASIGYWKSSVSRSFWSPLSWLLLPLLRPAIQRILIHHPLTQPTPRMDTKSPWSLSPANLTFAILMEAANGGMFLYL